MNEPSYIEFEIFYMADVGLEFFYPDIDILGAHSFTTGISTPVSIVDGIISVSN